MKFQRGGNIYLLGFMGSGKSTIAPLLAKKLKRAYFDTDEWIENQAGMSIAQIFHDYGENYFRKLENKCVELVANKNHLVVALGGGAVLRPENWTRIKNSGITVYLKCSLQGIWNRVKGQADTRPLLKGDTGQKLRTIEELLAARAPYYAQADLIINSGQRSSVEETVEYILEKLEGLI